VSLALGCALNTAVYRALNDVYSASLPYQDEERLGTVSVLDRSEKRYTLTGAEVQALRDLPETFEAVAVVERYPASRRAWTLLRDGNAVYRVAAGIVSLDLFRVLGARPRVGRVFDTQDAPGSPAAVLSHRACLRIFGSSEPLGRTILVGETPRVVVGVMSPDFLPPVTLFEGVPESDDIDVWVPQDSVDPAGRALLYNVVVKSRTNLDGANREMSSHTAWAAFRRAAGGHGDGCVVERLRDAMIGNEGRRLTMLLAFSLLLLAISVANVASILVLRSLGHRVHLAIRWALGANRRQMWTIPFIEAMLFSASGAACGGALGLWTYLVLSRLTPAVRWHQSDRMLVDTAVIVCLVMAVSWLCSLLVIPGASDTTGFRGSLVGGAGEASSPFGLASQRWVVRVQAVALLSVLAPALATAAALGAITSQAPLLARHDLILAECWMAFNKNVQYGDVNRKQDDLEHLARLIPGVEDVASSSDIPVSSALLPNYLVRVPGRGGVVRAFGAHVGPGYFRVAGVKMVAGRDFLASDAPTSPRVAIVSLSFAERAFGRVNVVGERIEWHGKREIVGVVEDHGFGEQLGSPRQSLFVPRHQDPVVRMCLYVRINAAMPRETAIQRLMTLDPEQPFDQVSPLDQLGERYFREQRGYVVWAAILGIVGLPLAFVGIGVAASYSVGSRRREIAIRRACGAGVLDVVWFLVRGQLSLLLPAMAIALPAQLWLSEAAQKHVLPLRIWTVPAILITAASVVVLSCGIAAASGWVACRGEVAIRLRSGE